MTVSLRRKGWIALLGATALPAALLSSMTHAGAGSSPALSLSNIADYGGEPSLVSDSHGTLYAATPSGGTLTYRSTDKGATWQATTTADKNSGDDCLGVDQSDAVYLCNLAGSQGKLPLQADVFKSTDKGGSWAHGAGFAPMCATSCNPFGVDRDWVDAAILPPNTSTDKSEVVLMYHDFYGPSAIWVNISTDGGKTFGTPIDVLAQPAITPGAVQGTLVAQGYTFCNTVPAGVGIVRPGLPHAGRIYVGWIAADLPQDLEGCNITQLESFHTVWISWSDDGGATWTAQQAYDAGIGHDTSTPFIAMTLDNQGNPYFGFAAQAPGSNPATCAAESAAGTLQSDTSCQYNMNVVWSQDGGATWDGGGGLIPGSAATAYQVNPPGETGTHFYPAIAAGNPGQVDVAYLYTPTVLPTNPGGKALAGGCAGPDPTIGNPPTYPAACNWNLYFGQSVNLTSTPDTATWKTVAATTTPMHVGDICNLGIFCLAPSSNRHLLDFIQIAIDPTTGCAHIAYPDDNTVNKLRAANQTAGCLTLAAMQPRATATPATPTATATPGAAPVGIPNTSAASGGGAGAGVAAAVALLAGGALASLRRGRRRMQH